MMETYHCSMIASWLQHNRSKCSTMRPGDDMVHVDMRDGRVCVTWQGAELGAGHARRPAPPASVHCISTRTFSQPHRHHTRGCHTLGRQPPRRQFAASSPHPAATSSVAALAAPPLRPTVQVRTLVILLWTSAYSTNPSDSSAGRAATSPDAGNASRCSWEGHRSSCATERTAVVHHMCSTSRTAGACRATGVVLMAVVVTRVRKRGGWWVWRQRGYVQGGSGWVIARTCSCNRAGVGLD